MAQTLDVVEEAGLPQDALLEAVEPQPDATYGQFDYTPMPVAAPISAVLGVCSFIAFLGLFGIALAVTGILVGLTACWKIWRSAGAYGGKKPAVWGLMLSTVSAIGGSALAVYNYQHELPPGFERVNFTTQISKKKFVVENGVQDVHPDVKALLDEPIFVKGFMYPTNQETGLSEFLLLKDNQQCCFGGQPALEDMIGVRVPEKLHVDYYAGRVSVAGTFKINPQYTGADSLEPLYVLDADYFTKAKTSF